MTSTSTKSMHKTPSQEEIAATLSHLKLSTKIPQKPASKPKSKPVADSWDDELSGSDTETDEPSSLAVTVPDDSGDQISAMPSTDLPPQPPPPTPASPTPFELPDNIPYGNIAQASSGARGGGVDKRPEKTTAVAGRLIAGALGVRAPKRTEEEREYDRAMREKERKRRDAEREQERKGKEAAEARKKAIWDD